MLKQILIALDQLLNALLGGFADETLSAHVYRMEQQKKPWGFMRRVIDTLLWFDEQHCFMSYVSEKKRLQSPVEER